MITVKFPDGEEIRAIILDEPVNGVSGIAECIFCDWRAVLLSVEVKSLSKEIESFAKEHFCTIFHSSKEYELKTLVKTEGITISKVIPKKNL